MLPEGANIGVSEGIGISLWRLLRFSALQIRLTIHWTALVLFFITSQSSAGDGSQKVFHDYKGAIHIHSIYSDGKGTIEEIANEARQVGLNFVITTDHDTLAPLMDGKEGWQGDVLVLVGSEITCDRGQYLALNIRRLPRGRDLESHIEQIRAQGGMGFIAHPFGFGDPWDWPNRTLPGFTGMEVYELTDDLLKESLLTHIKFLFTGLFNSGETFSSYLDRPAEELRKWDELTLQRKMVGIGGTNVHARYRVFGRTIDPYCKLFKLVQTHVLVEEAFTGDFRHDKALLYCALGRGHVYVAFGIWGEAKGFRFTASDGEREWIMGEEVPYSAPMKLRIKLPQEALIKLIRNGDLIMESKGRGLNYAVKEQGVYRVEVYRRVGERERLWILSNPIYFR